jgi:phosphate transport system permease protein
MKLGERAVQGFLAFCGALSIFTTIGIVAVLLFESLQFFRHVPVWQFLTDREWSPLFLEKHFGIAPLLLGTLLTTLIAVVVALPLGLLSAIFLAEYASPRVRGVVKPVMEILAGVPTVVYGYFALLFVTPVLQKIVPGLQGFNALSPGIVMGIMILPMVASLSEDAIYAVPQSLRDAAYALGSSKFQVALKVMIPAAFSGITASVILAVSRAIGETMIVAIAAGQQPVLTANPLVPVETMTAYIVQVSLGDTPYGTLEYQTIFVVGLSLFALTFILNLVSHRLKRKFYERYA